MSLRSLNNRSVRDTIGPFRRLTALKVNSVTDFDREVCEPPLDEANSLENIMAKPKVGEPVKSSLSGQAHRSINAKRSKLRSLIDKSRRPLIEPITQHPAKRGLNKGRRELTGSPIGTH